MSKREHYNERDYVEWLKSLGGVLYLPLSEEGDLQDRISGLSLQLTGQGSMVWDGSQQMYKITQPSSSNSYIAILNNGLTKNDFVEDNYTTIHSIKKITSSTSKNINSMSINTLDQTTSQATSVAYNGTGKTSAWPSSLANVAYVCRHTESNRSFFQNGELYGTAGEYAPYLPSSWIMNGSGVILGFTGTNSVFRSTQYYMNEVYLFNTALDLQTIRKIQGYE